MIEWPVRDLVPHSGDMVLIDEVLAFTDNTLTASASVRAGGLFDSPDGSWPAWLGLELMAQSIAAWAGCQARREGCPVKLGFLLGTRSYECNVSQFPAGTRLRIDIERTLQDETGIGVFECALSGNEIFASARVNVFQPAEAAKYLEES